MASPWGSEMKMSQIHVNKRPVLHYKYRKTPQTLFNHIENFYPKTWYLFVEHFLHLYTVYTIFTVYTALQGLFINDVIIFGGYPRFSLQTTHDAISALQVDVGSCFLLRSSLFLIFSKTNFLKNAPGALKCAHLDSQALKSMGGGGGNCNL